MFFRGAISRRPTVLLCHRYNIIGGVKPSSYRRRFEGRQTGSSSKASLKFGVAPKSFLIGSVAGICGSLAGMGGGFIMIPLLTSRSLVGLSQHQAHGTSLFAVTTTGLAGALSYAGHVDFVAATAIALCGMVTARLGASATSHLSEVALRKALGVFMLAVAPLIPAKQYLLSSLLIEPSQSEEEDESHGKEGNEPDEGWAKSIMMPAGIGTCSGFLAGLFGVGGGAIVVPALSLTTGMNHYEALGTSLCAMVLPAMVGTATHYRRGNVAMIAAPALAAGAFAGAYFGGRLGLAIPEDNLKYGFSGLMVVLGLRTLLK